MRSVADATADWAAQRNIPHVFTNETASTNDDAKRNVGAETAPTRLYLTAHQTAGRGRGSNQWLDTGAGESLLSTWSYSVDAAPQAVTGPRVGLCLFTAARRAWPSLDWGLKAPNDLYLGGLKIAGLLIETVSTGPTYRLLIGLGVNVLNHPRRFGTATHLGAAGDEGAWFQFLDEWVTQTRAALGEITQPRLTDEVRTDLKNALNANVARPRVVTDVTPAGDLLHAGGVVRWTDL